MVVDLANFITQIKPSELLTYIPGLLETKHGTYRPELMIGLFFKFHEMAWLFGWG